MGTMFGTDGIRGVANRAPVSPEIALALGRALVEELAPGAAGETKPCVVLGRDTRLSGPMLEAAVSAGICSGGADVLNVGVLPTPGIAYLTRARHAIAGVVISASHNAYIDNGIKCFAADGSKLPDHIEEAIEQRLTAMTTWQDPPVGSAIGTLRTDERAAQDYIEFLRATFPLTLPLDLRIGLDCANGAASYIAPALFHQLGATVRVWHATPDGLNINRQCGSLYPELLQQHVRTEGLDVGFAFDGDADRLLAVDHTGAILDGDHILAICAQAQFRDTPTLSRVVVSTVMANIGLDRALAQQHITLYRTGVGDKYVAQAMHEQGAMLGGEQSGHIIFRNHHTTGDGLLTALQLLKAMLTQHTSLAALAQTLCKFPQVLVNVKLHTRQDPTALPRVQQTIRQAEALLAHSGRVLVRLSGTEAVARVMVEGAEQTVIQSLADQIALSIASELGSA